jgi:small subunit ribosomal protein S14
VAKTCKIISNQRQPKFAVRGYNRCNVCGRPRAYIRKFGVCRICFRNLSLRGQIPGVTKSSW